jgi:lantibiotic modifying enzyme
MPLIWQPILSGREAARAAAAIDAIAAALAAWPAFPAEDPFGSSLATGEAGLALFFSYLDRARPGGGYADLAEQRLDCAIERLATSFHSPGFYQGFTSVAWAAEHLRARAPETAETPEAPETPEPREATATPETTEPAETPEDAPAAPADDAGDPSAEIDRVLLDLLANTSRWSDDYDLTSGLAGFGAYALERLPGATAAACLARVCERLAELAVPQEAGLAWQTPEWSLRPEQRQTFPHGMFELGVAHGVSGLLPVLAQAMAAGGAAEPARSLLRGAVEWLLSRRLSGDGASVFPAAWGPGAEPQPARTAWCYGDPGIAATLWVAARAAGEPAWEAEALALARAAARGAPRGNGVRDAGLCHGAAGLGHLFNRLHQASGDPELLAAARIWMTRALDLREPGRGVAGFAAWGPDPNGEIGWRDDPSLLTGAAGVALALLAAISPVEPAWDRFMLLSPACPGSGGTTTR